MLRNFGDVSGCVPSRSGRINRQGCQASLLIGSRYLSNGCTIHWLSHICDGQVVHFHIKGLLILAEGTGQWGLKVCDIFIFGGGCCFVFLYINLSGGCTYLSFPHHSSHLLGAFMILSRQANSFFSSQLRFHCSRDGFPDLPLPLFQRTLLAISHLCILL